MKVFTSVMLDMRGEVQNIFWGSGSACCVCLHENLSLTQTLTSKPCIVSVDNRGIWESTKLETGREVDHSSENKHTCKLASLSPALPAALSLTAPPGSWPAGCRWAHLPLPCEVTQPGAKASGQSWEGLLLNGGQPGKDEEFKHF